MHSQHATQCTTSANIDSHMGDGCFPVFFYDDEIQTENFIRAKTENYLYYRGEKHY